MGNGQGSSCYPDEVSEREQKRCQTARVSMEIVRKKKTQTMGSDNARNLCINGTIRVRAACFLQSSDLKTWNEWTASTKDHAVGRFKSCLPGGRDDRDGDRITARGAGRGHRLGRKTLEVAQRKKKGNAQLSERVAERAFRDELQVWSMVASNRNLS